MGGLGIYDNMAYPDMADWGGELLETKNLDLNKTGQNVNLNVHNW